MKYKIGDKVILKKGTPLYKSSTASSYSSKTSSEIVTNITRVVNAKHPYNTTGNLGWCDEAYILPYDKDTKYEVEIELIDKTGLIDYLKDHPGKIVMIDSEELKKVLGL